MIRVPKNTYVVYSSAYRVLIVVVRQVLIIQSRFWEFETKQDLEFRVLATQRVEINVSMLES